ncbi:hypothetical protein [Halostreptopolyspora alba]|uniref:Uncharacterized protein n=1 Tax=Halostreptopolyspora alba TaxID=2487137 RepID=A0A3N0EDY2_9ACTN|nr:hypothetical protein EFW17_05925 [Nocardiopsaceae bacterium YIM 96095]
MSTTATPTERTAGAPDTGDGGGRRLLTGAALALGLPLLVALLVFCLASPATNATPEDLPVGVVGATGTTEDALRDEGFEPHAYEDADQAREAIRDREVYGALVLTPPESTVLVASAASANVAATLRQQGTALAAQGPATEGAPEGQRDAGSTPDQGSPDASAPAQPAVEDVVPNPDGDPNGAALASGLLPLIGVAAAAGSALSRADPRRLALLGWTTLFALVGGFVIALLLRDAMDVLGGGLWSDAGVLSLTLFSVASVSASLSRAIGVPGFALVILTLVTVGLPASGTQLAPESLTEPWRTAGPYLQPAAGLDLLRGTAYFDGAATAGPAAVLLSWSALGLVLLLLPRRNG